MTTESAAQATAKSPPATEWMDALQRRITKGWRIARADAVKRAIQQNHDILLPASMNGRNHNDEMELAIHFHLIRYADGEMPVATEAVWFEMLWPKVMSTCLSIGLVCMMWFVVSREDMGTFQRIGGSLYIVANGFAGLVVSLLLLAPAMWTTQLYSHVTRNTPAWPFFGTILLAMPLSFTLFLYCFSTSRFGFGALSLGVASSFFPVLLLLLFAYGQELYAAWYRRWRCDSFIVVNCARAINTLNSELWHTVESRRWVIRHLESIARSFEIDVPRVLQSADERTQRCVERRAQEVAAAVRDLVQWVATPTSRTREDLIERLHEVLEATAIGHWDRLPRREITAKELKQRWSRKAVSVLRTVVVAFTPYAAFVIFHRLNGDLVQPTVQIANSLAFAWAVFTLLSKVASPDRSLISLILDSKFFSAIAGGAKPE